MAYTEIDDPSAYFQTTLYTGTGSSQAVTNGGNSDLQPDWVWVKRREGAGAPKVTDSVRGVTVELEPHSTGDDYTETNGVTAFGSDGFTVGSDGAYGGSDRTYVAWQWKAGTSFTNDASSTSVGSIDSAGSVNTDAGFSIISYTGTGSSGTIAHGLGAVPGWMIIKCRSENGHSWKVYHKSIGATKTLALQNNSTPDDDNNYHDDTEPTSSVFTIGSNGDVNDDGETFIAYLFAEKKGYSKFGKYSAVGNVDGNFIYLGFKPSFFLAKRITDGTESWVLFDNKRGNPFNGVSGILRPNLSEEETSQDPPSMDFLSNGVKFRNIDGTFSNTAGKEFIYMAFAEQPFVTSTGVPATAR